LKERKESKERKGLKERKGAGRIKRGRWERGKLRKPGVVRDTLKNRENRHEERSEDCNE